MPTYNKAYFDELEKLANKTIVESEGEKRSLFDDSIDPLGRILVSVESKGHTTLVSFEPNKESHLQNDRKRFLKDKIEELSEGKGGKIVNALEASDKRSVSNISEEIYFHLNLTRRAYESILADKSKPNRLDANKIDVLKKAFRETFKKVNSLLFEMHAEALIKAYEPDETINIARLNQSIDEMRGKLTGVIHQTMLSEIKKQESENLNLISYNGSEPISYANDVSIVPLLKQDPVIITQNDIDHIKHTTSHLTAREHDLLIINEGPKGEKQAQLLTHTEVTSHTREKGKDKIPDIRMITASYNIDGQIKAVNSRIQVRVPSLDLKKGTPKEDTSQVAEKLSTLKEKYFSAEQLGSVPGQTSQKGFVYNLFTSMTATPWLRDDNKQTQGARAILSGAHQYNRELIEAGGTAETQSQSNHELPFAFVQNIPVNGHGATLGYGFLKTKTQEEATLMSEMAMLHTLQDALPDELKTQFLVAQKHYIDFLPENDGSKYFSQHQKGKLARQEIEMIKNAIKIQEFENPKGDVKKGAQQALMKMMAQNKHYSHKYAKTIQTLSVYLEGAMIGGCKSANERAQHIFGRVAVLDQLQDTPDIQNPSMKALKEALTSHPLDIDKIQNTLDKAYNDLGLNRGPARVSLGDQGAAAKLETKSKGFSFGNLNTNRAESSSLTNLHSANTGKMQAHKGMVSSIIKSLKNLFSGKKLKNAITAETYSSISQTQDLPASQHLERELGVTSQGLSKAKAERSTEKKDVKPGPDQESRLSENFGTRDESQAEQVDNSNSRHP